MKNIFITLILLFEVFSVKSQIVFNGSTTGSGAGVNTLTYSKTIASGNNRLLYVGVTTQNKAISGVTWNGLALTQFTIGTRNSMRVAMYYIALGSSASPTTANVVVTLAGGTDVFSGAADYSGVWQPTPFQSPTVTQAKSLYPSITFTSLPGHKAVSLMGDIAASPVANGAGQTQYWSFAASHANRSTEKPGAASVTMSHTLSANEDWVMIGGTMLDHAVMLPIELISFKAENKGNSVLVDWATAAEINNDYFTVQRSIDAINFEDIGLVDANGNSNITRYYSMYDERPFDGLSYYRLKQTDFDGSYTFSDIVAVKVKEISIVQFYPNPSITNATISIVSPDNMSVSFVITSTEGKIIKELKSEIAKGMNVIDLDVSDFADGNYIFSVQDKHKVYTQKQFIIK